MDARVSDAPTNGTQSNSGNTGNTGNTGDTGDWSGTSSGSGTAGSQALTQQDQIVIGVVVGVVSLALSESCKSIFGTVLPRIYGVLTIVIK